MCGRISQPSAAKIKELFFAESASPNEVTNLFNIAVGQMANVLYSTENKRIVKGMQFGLNVASKFAFNARAEGYLNPNNIENYTGEVTLHNSPIYGDYFAKGRCLIPVNSFIEGPEIDKLKIPYQVKLNYTETFALAAIYGLDVKSNKLGFAIITCWPNQLMTNVIKHHRMPVIIEQDYWEDWLNIDTNVEDMATLLRPYHSDLMETSRISEHYSSANYHLPYNDLPPEPSQQSLF